LRKYKDEMASTIHHYTDNYEYKCPKHTRADLYFN
jgi:hypothetical protein